jgi:hypothetical protein
MKFIKSINEYLSNPSVHIPDDLALWCMNFYISESYTTYDYNRIPSDVVEGSKNLIKEHTGANYLFRGFGDDKIGDIKFEPDVRGRGSSWTWDHEMACEFSSKYDHIDGKYSLVASVNIDNLKYIISMDFIMENITRKQIDLLDNGNHKNSIINYESEYEVIIFDSFIVKKESIIQTKNGGFI